MHPIAAIAYRSLVGLVIGCAVLALACGGSGKSQSGAGGTGAGGVSGSGGSPPATDAASTGTGGTLPGSGGTTTTSPPPGSGGVTATGGKTATGGTTSSTNPGSGGTTPATGSDAGPPATGGKPGSGGVVATGGVSATGGRTGGPGGDGGISTGGKPATGGTAGGGTTTARTGGAGGGGGNGGTTGTSTTAVPSAGCGKAPPADGRQNISVGGTAREFILKIPANYDNTHPYRLIFGFHGAKYTDDWVATGVAPDGGTPLSGPWFGLESAAAGSAIFVAPQAGSAGWGDSDLAFVDAMLSQFEAQLCIDKSRIFSTGFSMGAIMTITIGCNRADVFRAIAPMSGRLPSNCPNTQPIAYWASHGTNDTTIPIADGQASRDAYVKRNHCTTQTSTADSNNCVTYQGCDPGYPVIWCTFPGVHEPAPFAGPEIWQFLSPL